MGQVNQFSFRKVFRGIPIDKIHVDPSLCVGCGICRQVCPFGLPEKKLYGTYVIERQDKCTECSACKRNCPTQAIQLSEQKGCGCLWDVKSRQKQSDKKEEHSSQSCSCDASTENSDSNSGCCK
jgi:ferredoxin